MAIKCEKGHWFDPDMYGSCPHCNKKGGQLRFTLDDEKEEEEGKVFIADRDAVFGREMERPVTGWMVCTSGEEKGRDFRLHDGRNFIGRSSSMDVVLPSDKRVARERHCSITYDSVGNAFYAVPVGENIAYYNGKILEKVEKLHLGDKLQIGKTILVFVPFCQEGISWAE